jgi:Fe-S-cluster containining protein
MLKVIQEPHSTPWYSQGLRFECTGCGKCCTGSPGYIWVNQEEIDQMSEFLQLSVADFCRRYLRHVKGRYSLLEMPRSYDCIFLKDRKCQIYAVRPTQCRTFPWWTKNLKSEQDWKEAARFCEGIQASAPVVPQETIEQQKALFEKSHES